MVSCKLFLLFLTSSLPGIQSCSPKPIKIINGKKVRLCKKGFQEQGFKEVYEPRGYAGTDLVYHPTKCLPCVDPEAKYYYSVKKKGFKSSLHSCITSSKNLNCSYWSYDFKEGLCYCNQSDNGNDDIRIPDAGYVSGLQNCTFKGQNIYPNVCRVSFDISVENSTKILTVDNTIPSSFGAELCPHSDIEEKSFRLDIDQLNNDPTMCQEPRPYNSSRNNQLMIAKFEGCHVVHKALNAQVEGFAGLGILVKNASQIDMVDKTYWAFETIAAHIRMPVFYIVEDHAIWMELLTIRNGTLIVSNISVQEEIRWRWVPLATCLIVFTCVACWWKYKEVFCDCGKGILLKIRGQMSQDQRTVESRPTASNNTNPQECQGFHQAHRIARVAARKALTDCSIDSCPGSDFECPICFDTPKPPRRIFSCSNRHNLCDLCLTKLDRLECPQCREDLTVKLPHPNYHLEAHLSMVYGTRDHAMP